MHLNKLRDVRKIKGEYFKFSSIGADDEDDMSDDDAPEQKDVHAFEMDSECPNGRLAFIYKG